MAGTREAHDCHSNSGLQKAQRANRICWTWTSHNETPAAKQTEGRKGLPGCGAVLLWRREAMEATVATSTRVPLPLLPTAGRPLLPSGLARPRRGFASISATWPTSTFGAGGGGGGRMSGGGGGGGDDSGAGAAAAAAAVAALGEAEQQAEGDSDAIVLHVGVTI